ncbi:MAG TPA: hypothetical protein VFU23_14820 [Gemmatimonadales bacterium]|nr:hypothetical protein [Gemmatimonadales bacterium]
MTTAPAQRFFSGIILLGALCRATPLHAQIEIGTWVRKSGEATPGVISMTVTTCCNGGRRLVYHMTGSQAVLTIESAFDGSEAPVLVDGKPSGETMAIKRLDTHHAITIVKMSGKAFGTSKATLSADGNTLTVVNDYTATAPGQRAGKSTEVWVRKAGAP